MAMSMGELGLKGQDLLSRCGRRPMIGGRQIELRPTLVVFVVSSLSAIVVRSQGLYKADTRCLLLQL